VANVLDTSPRSTNVVLGVAGGIAAYKACELLRLFTESGYAVRVVPTAAALRFVGVPTWAALSGQPVVDCSGGQIILPHAGPQRQTILIIGRTGQDHSLARPFAPTQHAGLIPYQQTVKRGPIQPLEAAAAIIAIYRHFSTPPAAQQQVIPTVLVHVPPCHARPQLAELPGQQWLPLKIVELILVMAVMKQLTLVFKDGSSVEG